MWINGKARLALGLIAATLMLGSCTAHRSSAVDQDGYSTIYDADEKHVFDTVYSSIQEEFPTEKISTITTPTRGYITKFLAPPLNVDWFTQKILVHKATGKNSDGELKSGYWIEVSGSGSSFLQGQMKNEAVFNTIIRHLDATATKHLIANRKVQAYSVPQENFYVRGSDTLEGEGTRIVIKNSPSGTVSKDKEKQLRDLHQLFVDKILTKDEYEDAKRKILGKY
jgi:hypothetical protein